jgi:hypothetical protein
VSPPPTESAKTSATTFPPVLDRLSGPQSMRW